jgi:signal transduction histidine kinase
MTGTIGRRMRNAILLAIVVTLLGTIAAVYVVSESLEDTVLRLDIAAERDFILAHHDRDKALVWDSATLKAVYEPDGLRGQIPLAEMFRSLSVPYHGEVHLPDGETYLITTHRVQGGRLYLAKNITVFEHRQTLFGQSLAVLALIMMALGMALAYFTSRRLVRPLRQLADFIRNAEPAPNMPRIANTFQDSELREIAATFNLFLDELEKYVKREQMLLSLASHELRTPIAVIGGALEVVGQRGQLREDDARTVERMRRATEEMRTNIDLILRLTRRQARLEERELVELAELTREVLDDLQRSVGGVDRVRVEAQEDATLVADRTLVKMLLRNLIQNTLQHTQGRIWLRFTPEFLEIRDEGSGLSEDQRALLRGAAGDLGGLLALSGLGLFIITLSCERLGWQLTVPQSSEQGTTMRLTFRQEE